MDLDLIKDKISKLSNLDESIGKLSNMNSKSTRLTVDSKENTITLAYHLVLPKDFPDDVVSRIKNDLSTYMANFIKKVGEGLAEDSLKLSNELKFIKDYDPSKKVKTKEVNK